MAGKRDSRRHSTTSFSKNVVVAKTSYEMLDYQDYFAIETWFNLFQKDNSVNFSREKKYDEAFGMSFFKNTRKKKLQVKSRSRCRSRPRI